MTNVLQSGTIRISTSLLGGFALAAIASVCVAAESLDLAVYQAPTSQTKSEYSFSTEQSEVDSDPEIRIGDTVGLMFKGKGENIKVDAFLTQGEWEMRGKFLTGSNPINVDGLMFRFERSVDLFSWMDG